MARGSVRKKGRKWYYRFYVEDDSGRRIQKEFAGTESKAETEAMLRQAMKNYEEKKLLLQPGNVTVADLLDRWLEEEVKPGTLSNGTLMAYDGTIRRIKQFPFAQRKLKSITPEHLQEFFDQLTYGDEDADGMCLNQGKPISRGYMLQFSAIMNGAFRYAVYPGRMLPYNLMQYVKVKQKKEAAPLFQEKWDDENLQAVITEQQFVELTGELRKKSNPALLPIQIAYYTGLRLGEACGLTWQDINLKEKAITVRRSLRYNGMRHKTELGTTKRNKVRIVYFGDVLAGLLKKARMEQKKGRAFGASPKKGKAVWQNNYYVEVQERDRIYYEVYSLPEGEEVPPGYHKVEFVCTRPDGSYEAPGTVSIACHNAARRIKGLEGFHFHQLRHTYTSNLLKKGASPKDVQELLGHGDINTTMNIYAHGDQENKRNCSKLLDQMARQAQ